MHRLIYVSRQAFAPDADIPDEVAAIIRASIRNNRQADITGLLLVHGGWFLQALEGPRAGVEATYDRIAGDPRHTDCRVLSASQVAGGRAFHEWDMCARSLAPSDEAVVDALEGRAAFEPGRLNDRTALRLLKAIRGLRFELARPG